MKKQNIFKRVGVRRAPGNMDFSITEKVLKISVMEKDVCMNMQTNNSAFESWMLCIMSKLHSEIDKVILTWGNCKNKDGHYNRFLYRVMKSCEIGRAHV